MSATRGGRPKSIVWLFILAVLIMQGCQPAASPTPTNSPTPQPSTPPTTTATAAPAASPPARPSATPTPVASGLWAAVELPAALRAGLQLQPGIEWAASPEQAAAHLEVAAQPEVGQWIFALAAPFPTIADGVSTADLQAAWQGELSTGPFAGLPLMLDAGTLEIFTALWGHPPDAAVRVLPASELLDAAWEAQPSWALVPFETLEPRWKVLSVDAQSPLHKDFNPQAYALSVPFGLTGAPPETILAKVGFTNRDPDKLTTVMLTGVTALVRATAETMRRKGLTYPAQDIGPWLREADILHINNEVPFDPDCPQPDPDQVGLVFCSRPEYMTLLEDIGTDVVDLSGDHFADFGPEAMIYTLDLYQEKGIPHFGGGYTEADARQPLLIEHNGNKIAFLGCNAKGGGYATARGDYPGAVECDYDLLAKQIADVKSSGYLPIVTVQDVEYYSYVPQPLLIEHFRRIADAGPIIVSGNQAHQPHGMEFYGDTFIHYGLGNLFFDQYHFGLPTGHAFIDRHVIYDGRYISTELLGIRFVDFARSRPMTPDERQELLERAFEASLW
jgi:hypothetical protein